MNDNHIIRVIFQGIDRLSGVMRDAANRSGPALDSMRERMRRVQNESNKVNASVSQVASNVESVGNKADKTRARLDRLTDSFTRLRNAARQKFGPTTVESADEMFTRLRKQGAPPRVRREQGGLPMFQSREDFVNQENARRAIAAQNAELERQNTIVGRLINQKNKFLGVSPGERSFEGVSPVDDFKRGFGSFQREALEAQDTLQEAQLKNQQALADFDDNIKKVREEHIKQNEVDKAQVESIVRLREENVRKGLASISKELDKFIIDENLKLKNKKIQIGLDLGPSDEDRRIARSTSKKIPDEERNAARVRVAEAKKAVNTQNALEEAATAQRIANRRHETAEINRMSLDGIKEGEREELNAATSASRRRLQIFDAESKAKRIKLRESQQAEISDLPGLIKARNDRESEAIRTLKIDGRDATGIEKLGARASRGVGDFFRGFSGARQKFKEFEGDARKVQTVAAQVGARFGDAARDVNKLVNVRWAMLLSLIGVLGTVVTQLAGALVAVASSAVLAAGALGGALVTGVLAAIPVVGLLAAAFHGLEDAMKVVELRQQARTKGPDDQKSRADAQRRAGESLADAQHALKSAHEGVTDAERGIVTAHEAVKDANYDLAQSIRGVADAQRALKRAHEDVTDAEKSQKDAIQDLADARRDARRAIVDAAIEEKDARLGVREAELGVLDAKQRLADFERTQRQGAAQLGDAQAALKEAQDRLALARSQGDAIEIATASAALSAARGNVNTIRDQVAATANQQRDLETGVKRAELSERQAKIRRDRAVADNKRVRSDGVEGAPGVKSAVDRVTQANRQYRDAVQGVRDATRRVADAEHNVTQSRRGLRDSIQGVVAANHRLRDSHYAVANAQRSVKDAYLAVTDAAAKLDATQKNAQREFNNLSPGQQEFVKSMEEFQKTYKKYIAPITDTIISAFSRGLRGAGRLMRDPEIRRNLQTLANQIADIGDKFTKWVISPEGRRTINFFIREASRNLPKIAEAAGNFARALLDIGKAAAPVFDRIVSAIDNISKKFREATREAEKFSPEDVFHHREENEGASKLDKFFNTSGKHLTAWGKLTAAVGNFFKALVGAAAPEGLKMVQGMTRFFNRMADAIDRNPKKVGEFFKNVREGLQELLPSLGEFALTLINIFTSKEMIAFTQFMLLTVIPAVLNVIKAIGGLIRIIGFVVNGFDDLLTIPLISTLGKWIIGFGIFFGILSKIFPIAKILVPVLEFLGAAIVTVFQTLGAFLIGNPYIAAILAIIAIIIILDRHFHFLRPTILAVKRAFEFVLDWVKEHWKLLASLLLGPFTFAIYEIHKHWGTIKRSFVTAYNFIKSTMSDIGHAIYDGFLWPFKKLSEWFGSIGGWLNRHLINPIKRFFGIASPSTLMFDIGMSVVNGFLNAIKKLPSLALGVLKSLPGKILGLFEGFGGQLLAKIYDKLPKPLKGLINGIGNLGGKAAGKAKDLFGGIGAAFHASGGEAGSGAKGRGPQGTDTVPAWLTPGEWVLNKAQQLKLAAHLGASVDTLSLMLFGGKGRSPKNSGRKTTPSGATTKFPNGVELIPHTDDYGTDVWFLKLANGEFAQVTGSAATKIQKSKGTWFPNYIKRAHGGPFMRFQVPSSIGYAGGGIVSFAASAGRGFGSGGVVGEGGSVITSPSGNHVEVSQEFNVRTEGESDWNHIMRLGAQKAQEAYA